MTYWFHTKDKGYVFLFSVPKTWRRFLCFGKCVSPRLLPPGSREDHYLSSRVLPTEKFVNSVSIAQLAHRRLARLSLHSLRPGLGPEMEIRKDRSFSSSKWLYRIYLDNFDALEKCDEDLAQQIKGKPFLEVLALSQGYQAWGLPRRPKKSVEQQPIAEIQGAILDGVKLKGTVRPKPQKVLKYVELA